MIYSFLAEIVLVFHFAFILYAIFGAAGVWFFPRSIWLHLPCFLWAGAIMLTGAICPLTPLEIHLRRRAGEEGFDTTFIEHYLLPIVYPEELTRTIQVSLGILVLGWNFSLYYLLWRRNRRKSTP